MIVVISHSPIGRAEAFFAEVLFLGVGMFTRTRLAIAAVVCLAWAAPILTAAEPSSSAFGRAGTVKARVPAGGSAAPLINRGARLVADYGSFVILEAPADTFTGQNAEILPQENTILLN